jgi:stage II sporulation protein D
VPPRSTPSGAANGGWSAAGTKPYLVAQADPYDRVIPNGASSWTSSVPVASIEAKWPSIGSYRQLRVLSRDGNGEWGGRVLQAAVDGSAGSVTVTGATIRSALGLRSRMVRPHQPALRAVIPAGLQRRPGGGRSGYQRQ